ncbi:MAG: glutamate racemase [Patescibacteria group bacterium]
MKIGVFDSGVGGLSVANAIKASIDDIEIVLREDKEHVPYGTRSPQEILGFVTPIFQELVDAGCQVIVVACNTVTTTLIEDLRKQFSIPLVAIEPMVKPAAALTKSKTIVVCATPTTLASPRYDWLKQEYAESINILEPDCSDWSSMIEDDTVDQQTIATRINEVLTDGADVIVLACTHYHWIEDEIVELARGKAEVMQPETAIIEQLKRVLARL